MVNDLCCTHLGILLSVAFVPCQDNYKLFISTWIKRNFSLRKVLEEKFEIHDAVEHSAGEDAAQSASFKDKSCIFVDRHCVRL